MDGQIGTLWEGVTRSKVRNGGRLGETVVETSTPRIDNPTLKEVTKSQ